MIEMKINEMNKLIKLITNLILIYLLIPKNIHYSEIYCKTHRIKLIHNKIISYGKNNTPLEIGYCYKCKKELCEYSDISNVYISNYEWLYNDDN